MNESPSDREKIKEYLLGQIPSADESQVEARLLTDPNFYDELSIVEDELIDQYLSSALSVPDRQSFESHFVASSERRQKVRFAKALRKHVVANQQEALSDDENELNAESPTTPKPLSPPRPSSIFPFQRPLVSYAVAASILIVMVGGALWLSRSPTTSGRVLAIELTPTLTTREGGEAIQFSVPSDVDSVRLQLNLPANEYQLYQAALRDSSLRTLQTTTDLKPQSVGSFFAVMVDVKSGLLAPGDYRIQLSGTTPDGRSESVATFSFTVRPSL